MTQWFKKITSDENIWFTTSVEFDISSSELQKLYGDGTGKTDIYYELDNRNIIIKWEFKPSYTKWGISNFGISVPDQEIELTISKLGWDNKLDEEVREEKNVKFYLKNIGVDIKSKFSLNGDFAPIEFDYSSNVLIF